MLGCGDRGPGPGRIRIELNWLSKYVTIFIVNEYLTSNLPMMKKILIDAFKMNLTLNLI